MAHSWMCILLTGLICYAVFRPSSVNAARRCKASESCIPLENCSPRFEIFKKLKSCGSTCISLEDEQSLKKSICGFRGFNPLVCCSSTPEPPPSPVDPSPVDPPGRRILDVSNHPSLGLLPDPSSCGKTPAGDRIIGGENAELGEWPWMVLLSGTNKKTGRFIYFCGGVLISDRYVVTAAHCVTSEAEVELDSVRLGEHEISKNPDISKEGTIAPPYQEVRAEEIVTHEKYNKNCQHCNDIALIRLSEPAQIQYGFISPICLPTNTEKQLQVFSDIYDGKNATAAGWGITSQSIFGQRRKDILQQVQIPIHGISKCSVYEIMFPEPTAVLCGGEKGKDTCSGDSGGPLIMLRKETKQKYLVGITSIGPKQCASENFPALYTRVSHFMPWILDNIRS